MCISRSNLHAIQTAKRFSRGRSVNAGAENVSDFGTGGAADDHSSPRIDFQAAGCRLRQDARSDLNPVVAKAIQGRCGTETGSEYDKSHQPHRVHQNVSMEAFMS